MKVLVIGANGNTGFQVVQLLASGPHTPVAMIRNADQQARFDQINVATVTGDLEYPIDDAVRGASGDVDAIIFAAGSGSGTGKDKTVLIDHLGAIRSMVASHLHGVRRYIMLSSLNADTESQSKIAHYHRAKAHADAFLRNMDQVLGSGLDWTTVHPGRLNDEPATNRVEVRQQLLGQGGTSRANTAAALVMCLQKPNTIGKSFALLDGDTPIDQALGSV